jgi:cell division protein ZipA
MDQFRWILLGAAIILVIGIYLFGRQRKKSHTRLPLDAANQAPSFSADDDVDDSWVDGVSPVRVVSQSDREIIEQFQQEIAEPSVLDRDNPFAESADTDASAGELMQDDYQQDVEIPDESLQAATESADTKSETHQAATPAEQKPQPEPQPEQQQQQQTEQPVDDVIAVFVMAEKEQPPIKGEQILSASYALNLQHGDMKIFHRHSKTDNSILFSMANVFDPGWFELEQINQLETRGITFFMQVNRLEDPADVLDEMLICAHRMSTMLGASLCNAHRQPLDESYTRQLREKVQTLIELKAQTA